MKYWDVTVTGLGGPMGEYAAREYEIFTETPAQAIDQGIAAFLADKQLHGREPYHFYSARVSEGRMPIRIKGGAIERGLDHVP